MRLLPWLLSLMLLAGCSGVAGKDVTLPAAWPKEPSAVIFQSFARGGFTTPLEQMAQAPALTLLADGRVIYRELVDNRVPRYMMGRVDPSKLPPLYDLLRQSMAPLKAEYQAGHWTDDTTTRFSLWTPEGLKVTGVYGFHAEPSENEQEREVLAQLRKVLKAVMDALGTERTPYQPDQARLIVAGVAPEHVESPAKPWPAEWPPLPAVSPQELPKEQLVSGEKAKVLLSGVDQSPMSLYKQGNSFYEVRVVPVIPLHPD